MKNLKEIIESGLIEEFVFGNPTDQQIKDINTYVAEYPELKDYIFQLEDLTAKIATENAVKTPPEWKSEIINQATSSQRNLNKDFQEKDKPQLSQPKTWLKMVAACVLGGLFVGLLMYNKLESLKQELAETKKQYDQLELDCQQEKEVYASNQQMIDYLQDEHTQLVVLKHKNSDKQNHISIYWNDQQEKAVASIKHLDPLPANQTYQLWADVEGKMISIALLPSESQKFVDIMHLDNISSLNITIEPKGGSEHPTISRLILSATV